MTEDQLYNYSEVLADITYEVGYHRLRINNDSRTIISEVIHWAKEFQEKHKHTDWAEVEYLDAIYAFTEEKIAQYMFPIETECPDARLPTSGMKY